jgi:RNA polymerase sigma-70 factor (ECF subfamily)
MEAEDISQDIFILAWQAELILPPRQLQAYLRKAARSRYFDHWRHRQRTQQLLTQYGPELLPVIAELHPLAEDPLRRQHQLEKVLLQLNDSEQQLLIAHYQEALSLKEIAQRKQVSVAAIKMRLYRLKRKLRYLLGGKDHGSAN